jgi:sodium-dependent dicarboxylate transporter 2/3/5
MAIWWASEAIPIPITALIPFVVFPLSGVASVKDLSAAYMHPVVVLLMGGFMIAKVIERWGLHQRIALNIIARAGDKPSQLIAGFMCAGALTSMWVSNSATCIMLMPIGVSVAAEVYKDGAGKAVFTRALLLALAYACSVGGIGTPIGTPTNLIAIGYLEDTAGFTISFWQWMLIGIPVVMVVLPLIWYVITRILYKLEPVNAAQIGGVLREKLDALGRLTPPESRTIIVISIVSFLWIAKDILKAISIGDVLLIDPVRDLVAAGFGAELLSAKPLGRLNDQVTVILGVLLCFLIPSGSLSERKTKLLDWETTETIPWGPLLMFGGGLALAMTIRSTGLGVWFGELTTVLSALPPLLLLVFITAFVIFLTELMSNVATISSLMPVLGATMLALGIEIEYVAIPATMAASCAFMLPMATGPNAVVYGSRQVDIQDMIRAGFLINLGSIVILSTVAVWLTQLVLA